VVLILPSGLVITEKCEEAAAAKFSVGCFDEKGAASAGADDGINLLDQVVGKEDVCSL